MYEGSPDWPDKDRFWSLIEKYKISCVIWTQKNQVLLEVPDLQFWEFIYAG